MTVLYPRCLVEITDKSGKGYKTRSPARVKVQLERAKPSEGEISLPLSRELDLHTFQVGNDVAIALGNDVLGDKTVLAGEVYEIGPNLPVVVKCRDRGGQALANAFTGEYRDKEWADIVADAIGKAGLEAEISDAPCPTTAPRQFRVDGHTPAQILEKAVEATGWTWQVIGGTNKVFFGPRTEAPKAAGKAPIYVFAFGARAPLGAPTAEPNVIRSALQYKGGARYKKVVVPLVDDGWKAPAAIGEYEAPDYEEGDPVFRVSPPIKTSLSGNAAKDRKRAEERAYEEFLKLGAGGFEGSFTTFLNPFVEPGMRIKLVDNDHPERSGYAVVAKATHELSPDGGGRTTPEVYGVAEGFS